MRTVASMSDIYAVIGLSVRSSTPLYFTYIDAYLLARATYSLPAALILKIPGAVAIIVKLHTHLCQSRHLRQIYRWEKPQAQRPRWQYKPLYLGFSIEHPVIGRL